MLERDRDLYTLRPTIAAMLSLRLILMMCSSRLKEFLGASYFRIAFERIRADSEGFAEGFQVLEWWALEGLNL
jgi:hypothetical protein